MFSMIKRQDDAKEDFKFLSKIRARTIIQRFVKNQDMLEKLLAGISDDEITGFQLRDILSENYGFEKIKLAINNQQRQKVKLDSDPRLLADEIDETESEEDRKKREEFEKKKRFGFPAANIEELLTSVGCEKTSVDKLKEQNIESDVFWDLDEEGLEKHLEIKAFGTRKRLIQRMKEITMEHNAKMEEQERASKKISQEEKAEIEALVKQESANKADD